MMNVEDSWLVEDLLDLFVEDYQKYLKPQVSQVLLEEKQDSRVRCYQRAKAVRDKLVELVEASESKGQVSQLERNGMMEKFAAEKERYSKLEEEFESMKRIAQTSAAERLLAEEKLGKMTDELAKEREEFRTRVIRMEEELTEKKEKAVEAVTNEIRREMSRRLEEQEARLEALKKEELGLQAFTLDIEMKRRTQMCESLQSQLDSLSRDFEKERNTLMLLKNYWLEKRESHWLLKKKPFAKRPSDEPSLNNLTHGAPRASSFNQYSK